MSNYEHLLTNFFCKLFNANVKQVINVSQIVAKKLISAGKPGSIVNMSSQVRVTSKTYATRISVPIIFISTLQYIIM